MFSSFYERDWGRYVVREARGRRVDVACYRRTGGYGNAFSEEDELRGRDEGDR